MNKETQRGLNDRLYEKRKAAALELEKTIRQCAEENSKTKIRAIVNQLCHEYAYAVHQPNARNGGLIGLAASAIALGSNVAEYLEDIIPPVLACFGDQDARVRYYACESMYNIAKVAKGEILLYFNEIFDALCRLAADSELTVKNGADLLDRLIKDIVAEKAATYVSIIHKTREDIPIDPATEENDSSKPVIANEPRQMYKEETPAFSLAKFIPLLTDRIYVINPFTRMFLVSWITLLDSIPDLELVSYLPEIISGLLNFLSDTNIDVRVATQGALDGFLSEIKRVAELKRTVYKLKQKNAARAATLAARTAKSELDSSEASSSVRPADDGTSTDTNSIAEDFVAADGGPVGREKQTTSDSKLLSVAVIDDGDIDEEDAELSNLNMAVAMSEGVYLPGQDIKVDFAKVIEILLSHLDSTEQEIQLTVLKWIESFFEISPDDLLPFVPRFLSLLLPTMAHDNEQLRMAAGNVNSKFMELIMSLPDTILEEGQKSSKDTEEPYAFPLHPQRQGFGSVRSMSPVASRSMSPPASIGRRSLSRDRLSRGRDDESILSKITSAASIATSSSRPASTATSPTILASEPEVKIDSVSTSLEDKPPLELLLDYPATVNALTLHFLNEREETRVAALDWLIMLYKKASRKILAINDGTFPALLKTLSDSSDLVVTKDLQLLAQISYNSEDDYFAAFMLNLLSLFSTDRKLLETRGNLIIRQLCVSLNPERIYRTLAEILEKEDDVEFASIMIQNLNNNLITAPELHGLRRQLRNLDTKDGTNFFISLFRSWCHNAVATFSLCLLAQAYEQAFHLLQIFADLEITVTLLIQVDKLIQLLESPVFTYLRLQLLEPEKYPFLYRCLYGLLMLLPQSSAFATLRNRLNSVSAIGYLHVVPPNLSSTSVTGNTTSANLNTNAAKQAYNRFKGRIDEARWNDLLDKFRNVQMRHERSRRMASSAAAAAAAAAGEVPNGLHITAASSVTSRRTQSPAPPPLAPPALVPPPPAPVAHHRSGLSFMSGKSSSSAANANTSSLPGASQGALGRDSRIFRTTRRS
ncbi:vacuolar protein 14 C-terminal Fig4p binding-domain-containing protein [Lipomyces arxii]|uniref:vacuolar protein 14 C-terminal Fig4p binding-domain-containing protein n=1 Tax=Lipomyces arxii TaxID=56418 RepID=UPI0034CE6192